jgi:hypothetical protein
VDERALLSYISARVPVRPFFGARIGRPIRLATDAKDKL